METTIRTQQYDGEIILPNLTSEAGAKTYGPPCKYWIRTSIISVYWLEEDDMFRMLYSPYLSDLALCDFYLFPTVKQNMEIFKWLTMSFLMACKSFRRVLIKRNWIGYFKPEYNELKK
jgi:hypothetical protein